jgi:Cu/Ag efflux pump CusA
MTAIPFGIVGAVLGHMLKGYALSLMGIVAVCGMVVNDLLVLDRLCEHFQLRESTSASEAIHQASGRRFRSRLGARVKSFLSSTQSLAHDPKGQSSLQKRFGRIAL